MGAAHISVLGLWQSMAGYWHLHHSPEFVLGGIIISANSLGRLTALAIIIGRQIIVAEDGFVFSNLRPVVAATVAKKVIAAAVGNINALIKVRHRSLEGFAISLSEVKVLLCN